MRSVWNGSIAFGQVAIPVRAYGATVEQGTGLHQLHVTDGGRIRVKRTCEVDGAEVPYDEIARGYATANGEVVVLTDEDFAGLPLPTTHAIEVCSFAPLEQVDPIYFARSYYLEPAPAGVRPYVLLCEALRQSGKVAVVKVALRQRESLGLLRVRDQVIVLATMLWPEEIRTPEFPFLDEDVPVRLSEVRAATELMDELSADFAPGRYRDGYRDALQALIEAREQDREVVRPTAVAEQAGVADLLTSLADPAVENATAGPSRQRERPAGASGGAASKAVDNAKAAARKAAAAKGAATRAANRAAKARDAANSP